MVNVTKQNRSVAWHSIKWKQVNCMVNNLRHRLYRATESGNLKKVSSLQKLILRSQSVRLQSIWLAERGLALSEKKTNIVHLEEGFDFLGFNVKRYKTNRTKRGIILLIKPSKESIKNFRQMVRQTWIKVLGWRKVDAIRSLNKKITGWGNYFKISTAKKIFSSLDYWMFKRQVRYLYRTHPSKHWHWYRSQYYGTIKGRKDRWVFQDKISKIYLEKLAWIPIRRHVMVKNIASPDNPKLKQYWIDRQKNKNSMTTKNKWLLWCKQQGKCPICIDKLDNGEELHIHHNIPRSLGGRNNLDNLSLLHGMCHRQIHSRQSRSVA